MLVSALNHAFAGLQLQERRFVHHAERIARWGSVPSESAPDSSPGDIAHDIAGIKLAARGYEANLAVVKVADDMIGTIVDLLA